MLRSPADITAEVSQEVRNQMMAQATTLSQMLSRVESSNTDSHRQTRETILECIKEGMQRSDARSQEDEQSVKDTSTVQCCCAKLRSGHGPGGSSHLPNAGHINPPPGPQFTSDFNNVFTSVNPRLIGTLKGFIQAAEGVLSSEASEITAGIEMLNVSKPAEFKLRRDVYLEICQSLQYPEMTHRYEDVIEAYPETFEWAFHDPTEEQLPWDNLAHWLEKGDGIYWVNGKAGSGKSTFMKHLYDDMRTRGYLTRWAANVRLCAGTFFFWNSGSREQKSQIGLLRALLFQLFTQRPNLIPIVLPELWAKTYSKAVNESCPGEDFNQFWSLRQLILTFKALIYQKDVPLKIFFMIDGLDEFDGDHEELATLFREITKNPDVKVLLSSRPWVVFEDIFGQCPNLRLQNLTYRDIERYVMGKLSRNDAFQRLSSEEPGAAPAITQEIVEKADGVFLWVRLVVRSLLKGIRNRDELSDLWARLRSMPREIEPLYDRLLDLIDPEYLAWASKAFQILRTNHNLSQDPFGKSSSARDGVKPLTVQAFFLAIKDDLDASAGQTNNRVWLDARCEDISVRLTARCAGLLEVTVSHAGYIKGERIGGPDSLIRYFHRTARDFLETHTHWCKILRQTANTDFNPNVSMMRSCLHSFRFAIANYHVHNPDLARDFMIYSYHADSHPQSHHIQSILLDKMNDTMKMARNSWWTVDFLPGVDGFPDFLKLTTIHGLRGYVSAKLSEFGETFEAVDRERATALLRCLLPPDDSHVKSKLPLPRIDMVSLLLDLGADPNGSSGSQSPWLNTLGFFGRRGSPPYSTYDLMTLELTYMAIMEKLVLAGANPHAVTGGQYKSTSLSAMDIVETILLPKYRSEAASLLQVLKCAMSKSNANGKRHRDEAEVDHEESRAKRFQVQSIGS